MLKQLIKRKLAALTLERLTPSARIEYSPGDSPLFSIRLNKTGVQVGLTLNKSLALQSLRTASIQYSIVSPIKEQEIVVWMRMQKDKDKPEIVDIVSKKFNIDTETAENLFSEAFPDGLEFEEESALDTLEVLSLESSDIDAYDILDLFEFLAGNSSFEPFNKNNKDYELAKVVVSSILRKRHLIR